MYISIGTLITLALGVWFAYVVMPNLDHSGLKSWERRLRKGEKKSKQYWDQKRRERLRNPGCPYCYDTTNQQPLTEKEMKSRRFAYLEKLTELQRSLLHLNKCPKCGCVYFPDTGITLRRGRVWMRLFS